MHKLQQYIEQRGLTQTQFGRLLEPPVSQGLVSQWMSGRSEISLRHAVAIHKMTSGFVPLTLWLTEPADAKEDRSGT